MPCQSVPSKNLPEISSSIFVGTQGFGVVIPMWYILPHSMAATMYLSNSATNSGGARVVQVLNGRIEPSSRTVDGSTSVVFLSYGLGNFMWAMIGSGLSRWKSLGSNFTWSASIADAVVGEAESCNPISSIERRPSIINTEYFRM